MPLVLYFVCYISELEVHEYLRRPKLRKLLFDFYRRNNKTVLIQSEKEQIFEYGVSELMCGIINRKNNLKTDGTLIHGNGILYSNEPNLNTTETVLF